MYLYFCVLFFRQQKLGRKSSESNSRLPEVGRKRPPPSAEEKITSRIFIVFKKKKRTRMLAKSSRKYEYILRSLPE